MTAVLHTFGRILARYWPALAAWYLAGEALHEIFVQLAGFVGGHTTLGGLLLLPLAVAARLISYVAMYLTVRPALPHSMADGAGSSYAGFARSVLVAILPFFAFYGAWGMLDADIKEFQFIAGMGAIHRAGYEGKLVDEGGLISVGMLPVFVLVLSLAVRVVLARVRDRLPHWTLAVAAYAEVLWTFMLFTLVGQWWARVVEWFAGRAGAVWFQDLGDRVAEVLPPLAGVWEATLWFLGLIIAAVIVPAAWLAVAGVIYGADFATLPPLLQRGTESLRGAVGTLSRALVQRLEDLWAAVAAIWRGGPLLFGVYAVVYALWALAEQSGTRGLLWLIGGHDERFWEGWLPLVLIAAAAVAEPLRVAIVATAFDAVVGRPGAGIGVRDSVPYAESQALEGLPDGDVEPEGAFGVLRQQEDREDAVGG